MLIADVETDHLMTRQILAKAYRPYCLPMKYYSVRKNSHFVGREPYWQRAKSPFARVDSSARRRTGYS